MIGLVNPFTCLGSKPLSSALVIPEPPTASPSLSSVEDEIQ